MTALGSLGSRALDGAVERSLRQQLESSLETSRAALRNWHDLRLGEVQEEASRERVVQAALTLARVSSATAAREARLDLQRHFSGASEFAPLGYFLVAPSGRTLTGSEGLGPLGALAARSRAFGRGYQPRFSQVTTLPSGDVVAIAVAPVEREGELVAELALVHPLPEQLGRLLKSGWTGRTGDIYLVDRQGRAVTELRFADERSRLAPSAPRKISEPAPEPGGPGGPLTRAAKRVSAGQDALVVEPYLGYRGVPVVGAWAWIPELKAGLIVERDEAEVLAPYDSLRWTLAALFCVFCVAAGAAAFSLLRSQSLTQEVKQVRGALSSLGSYNLEERLGQGAMGEVYRASHAMLLRPAAVKLLRRERSSEADAQRFEREVRATAKLAHPNTVRIFDFGRTAEGVFYYAMEFLKGIALDELVAKHGPQPEGRVVSILRQACGSLEEAHGEGLIHRDIKPANIMLCRQGAAYDLVKVVDFGLVLPGETEEARTKLRLTAPGAILGTPAFLAPEVIEGVAEATPASDIYALGAVGYVLLTGKDVFDTTKVMETLKAHLEETPAPLSERRGEPVSPALEALILRCLSKDPAQRPASAYALSLELAACPVDKSWADEEARAWWGEFGFADGGVRAPGERTALRLQSSVLLNPTLAIERVEGLGHGSDSLPPEEETVRMTTLEEQRESVSSMEAAGVAALEARGRE